MCADLSFGDGNVSVTHTAIGVHIILEISCGDGSAYLRFDQSHISVRHPSIEVDVANEHTHLRTKNVAASACYVEHAIQNARELTSGQRQIVSKRMQFVELTQDWEPRVAGYAPYLDYRPIEPDEFEAELAAG